MPTPHDLMLGLLDYIIEQAKQTDPRAFCLAKSKGFLIRQHEVRGLPGVGCDIQQDGDYLWLRVERLETEHPPAVPEALTAFLAPVSDPAAAPPVFEQTVLDAHLATLPQPTLAREHLDDAYRTYVRRWRAWSEQEKPRRASIHLYGDLFALKHQIEAEETANPQELVWGMGVSTWSLPSHSESDPIPFEYPLLTQAVEISIEAKSMVLEIRPRALPARAELDAILAAGTSGAAEVETAIRARLERPDVVLNPFDSATYEALLKLAASNLDANGKYTSTPGEWPAPPGPQLRVSDAWVLFSRPRSNSFVTEDIKRLKASISANAALPDGPLALVTPPSDDALPETAVSFRGLCHSGETRQGTPQELFFPLPYNSEQVTIIERLETSPGVTVQGPPGTGKTHTIANVICHYLATGRRVLVTSRGEPALEVLQEKIPAEVRPLTVALLASDREGVRQFEASIAAIQHRVSQLHAGATRQAIEQQRTTIDRLHQDLALLDRRVDAIAASQLSEIAIDGVSLRAQKVAEMVVADADAFRWFDDALTLAPEQAPPWSEADAERVRGARRRVGEDLSYLGARLPAIDLLPSVPELTKLHETLGRIETLDAELRAAPDYQLRPITAEVLREAEDFLRTLDDAVGHLAEVERDAPRWGAALREKCRDASFDAERKALEAIFTEIDTLTQARVDFLQNPVEVPPAVLTDSRTRQAITRAAQTGKAFGLLAFGAGGIRVHIEAIRVAGLPPKDAGAWTHVLRYLDLHERVVSFLNRWNTFAAALSIPPLAGGVTALRKVEAVAQGARKAHRMATFYDRALSKKAASVFVALPAERLLGDSQSLSAVSAALRRHLSKEELAKAAVARSSLQEHLGGTTGAIAADLRAFVDQELGRSEIPSAHIGSRYAGLLAELRRVRALAADLHIIDAGARQLQHAGATNWSARLISIPAAASGDDAILPVRWRAAWTWARMRGYIESIQAQDELRALACKRTEISEGLERAYRELVAQSAWLSAKVNATPRVLQALAGYAAAIRRIGTGRGENAMRHRKDARTAMNDAADAVPCWIMSHARISEAMPAQIGLFDLVIVDEASQSDLWALPAILRGKKILVVGDDKQVSPEPGFISASHISALRARFLKDQPYEASLTPEKSLYDLAARVFAAQQIMLREHFRCVTPIIAYSNRVFYKGAIQPLRTPQASERLDPPLVDIYAPGGYRNKHDANPVEARVIADEIGAILEDPAMAGRTLGVVSLLGMEQAKHIDELVRRRFAAAELLRRKFECGDARTFQGSERDILFLSLVADREQHHALSGINYEQRFNVAASRARDRMYLVRSVQQADLSDKDLRRSLLEHFAKPLIHDPSEVNDLSGLCESGFEREVFAMLTTRGYRVVPQVRVGGYRIDLVVEGAEDRRLAVELDGDDYHGPERWAADMERQRVLERVGWTFWRCFASTWTLDKRGVFDDLCARLATLGIEPIGALDRMPLVVEHRVWKDDAVSDPETEVAALMKRVANP